MFVIIFMSLHGFPHGVLCGAAHNQLNVDIVVRECSVCHYVLDLSMLAVMRLFVVWCLFDRVLF